MLRDAQPVKVPEQWGDVVVPPGREHQTGGDEHSSVVKLYRLLANPKSVE